MEKNIKLKDITLHYDESGPEDGAPILLLHGWGCKWQTLNMIRTTLNHAMHVYTLDLPGHGESPEPPEVWGVEEYTRLIEDFVKSQNLDHPILLGHSFGGRISILMSSRNDIRKVILVDAAGIKPKRKLSYYFKIYSFKGAKKLAKILPGEMGESLVRRVRGKFSSADYNAASPKMRAILSKCVNEDLKSVMPAIKADTLLIWGEEDTATPLSDARTMDKLIPNSGLVSFPKCGHYSFLDNPGQFRAVIQSFLKDELSNNTKQ